MLLTYNLVLRERGKRSIDASFKSRLLVAGYILVLRKLLLVGCCAVV